MIDESGPLLGQLLNVVSCTEAEMHQSLDCKCKQGISSVTGKADLPALTSEQGSRFLLMTGWCSLPNHSRFAKVSSEPNLNTGSRVIWRVRDCIGFPQRLSIPCVTAAAGMKLVESAFSLPSGI